MLINNPISLNPDWIFTHSQVKLYKTCKMKYYYKYIEKLEPNVLVRHLYEGSLIHKGIEYYYNSLIAGLSVEKIKEDLAVIINNEIIEKKKEYDKAYENVSEEMLNELDSIKELSLGVLNNYINFAQKNDQFELVFPEETFETYLNQYKITAKIDAIVKKSDGTHWYMEHKTTSSINQQYEDNLLLDEQINLYLYLLNQVLKGYDRKGIKITGVIYNIIRKKIPAIPRVLKDGKISSAKSIDTTPEVFIQALHDNHQTTAGYEDLIGSLNKNVFVKRKSVYRNKTELKNHIQDYLEILKELKNKKLHIQKNPDACKFYGCPYFSLCVEDTPENRKFNFHVRESINPEYDKEKKESVIENVFK